MTSARDYLDAAIDGLEASVGVGRVVIVADVDRGGELVPALYGNDRVLVASTTDGDATLDAITQASFSYAFWNRVFVGDPVNDCFAAARGTLQVFASAQRPLNSAARFSTNETMPSRASSVRISVKNCRYTLST